MDAVFFSDDLPLPSSEIPAWDGRFSGRNLDGRRAGADDRIDKGYLLIT